MIVTKLTQQLIKPDRVNVFIDNKYIFSLTTNQILDEKIRIGTQLGDKEVTRLKQLSIEGKIRSKALEWLFVRPRSNKELRTYLYKQGIDHKTIDTISKEFVEKNYQNDSAFANWWVEGRVKKNKSNIAIKAELLQKGISNEIIDEILQSAEPSNLRLKAVIKQKSHLSRYQDANKLKRYLLSKGFSYSEIEEALVDGKD